MKILSRFTVLVPMIIGVMVLSLASCEKDKDDNPTTTIGDIFLGIKVPNPDGYSGSGYIQVIDNIEPSNITNRNAFPVPYSSATCMSGNDVFILPSWGGETQLEKYTRSEGGMVKTGEFTLTENSGATGAVVKGDVLYVSCAFIGKILVIKHADMSLVKEIDISSYGEGDQNPDPGAMLVRDNLLYIGLGQTVGGNFPSEDRPYADVLIINTDKNQVVKKITSSTSGISYATRASDQYSIFMDENDDIYIFCIGGFGAVPGHNGGVLRIKVGETEFDNSYHFVFNSTSVEGESNKMDFALKTRYYKNGKVYSTAAFPAYYGNPANAVTDRTTVPVEIDIYNQTIKTIGLPYSNSIGVGLTIYNDKVIFGLSTNTNAGLYVYNPATKEASNNAVVTTEGDVFDIATFSN